MTKITKIHASKQPRRPHFIEAWAERRGLKQADLARELPADKSLVSRWYSGSSPSVDYQARLAAFFDVEPEDLFRHPDDNWMKRFFEKRQDLLDLLRDRSEEELTRIKHLIELTFPKKDGTNG